MIRLAVAPAADDTGQQCNDGLAADDRGRFVGHLPSLLSLSVTTTGYVSDPRLSSPKRASSLSHKVLSKPAKRDDRPARAMTGAPTLIEVPNVHEIQPDAVKPELLDQALGDGFEHLV